MLQKLIGINIRVQIVAIVMMLSNDDKISLLLLLLLHLLDQSQRNCEKLRFHNNGICDDETFGYSSTLGSGCTQPSFLVDHFHFP